VGGLHRLHAGDAPARARVGDVSDFYRLLLAPGVGHCMGGSGPVPTDPLAAVVAWVKRH
jgi:Tannase and feruloyl esterase